MNVCLRGTLDFKPSDTLLMRLSVNYAHSKEPTGPYQSKSTIGVANALASSSMSSTRPQTSPG